MDIWTREIVSKKVRWNNVDFLSSRITPTKVRGNDVHFSAIEITSKKGCQNNVDFSTKNITLEKVHGKHLDFLANEITSKKYVEKTWKFVQIWSSTSQGNIDDECTCIKSGVPIGSLFLGKHESLLIGSNYGSFFY